MLDKLSRDGRIVARGIVFDVDYQGARQIKAKQPSTVGIFILPPSMAELERRRKALADHLAAALKA